MYIEHDNKKSIHSRLTVDIDGAGALVGDGAGGIGGFTRAGGAPMEPGHNVDVGFVSLGTSTSFKIEPEYRDKEIEEKNTMSIYRHEYGDGNET